MPTFAGLAAEQEEPDTLRPPFSMPPPTACARPGQHSPSAHTAWQPRNQSHKGAYPTEDITIPVIGFTAAPATAAPATAAPDGPGFLFPATSVDRLGMPDQSPSCGYRGAVPWTSSETGDPFVDKIDAANMPENSQHLLEYNRLADKVRGCGQDDDDAD